MRSLLCSQSIRLRLGPVLSDSRVLAKDVPQGFALRPFTLAFNVVLSSTLPFFVGLSPEFHITVF